MRTLLNESRMIELENTLESTKWDIIGLAEIRRNYEGITENIRKRFCHTSAKKGLYSVGFYIKKKNHIEECGRQ